MTWDRHIGWLAFSLGLGLIVLIVRFFARSVRGAFEKAAGEPDMADSEAEEFKLYSHYLYMVDEPERTRRPFPPEETGASPRLSYVRVTSPKGAEGTINLMWDDYPIAWVNSKQIAREMMQEIPEANSQVLNQL